MAVSPRDLVAAALEVAFPLRVGVGLVALLLSFTAAVVVFSDTYQQTVDTVTQMIRGLGA